MSQRKVTFCLMWFVVPLTLLLGAVIYNLSSSPIIQTMSGIIAFAFLATAAVTLMYVADPSTRKSAPSKVEPVSSIPLKIKNDDAQYMLTDDGEIIEVVEDEKRKRGTDSTLE
jgi:hypothetical protein